MASLHELLLIRALNVLTDYCHYNGQSRPSVVLIWFAVSLCYLICKVAVCIMLDRSSYDV